MDKERLKEAIIYFEEKIKKQGHIVNARDAEHLKNLKRIYNNFKA